MLIDRGTVTLLRAIFLRTMPLLLTQLGLTLVFCLFIRKLDLSLGNRGVMDRGDARQLVPEGGESLLLTILVIAVNAFFVIGTNLLQHSDSKQLRIGFPVYVYLIPMPFRRVAMLHMGYGIVSVGLITWIAAMLTIMNLGASISAWQPAGLAMVVYSVMQAWGFIFGGRNRPASAAMSLAVGGALIVWALRNEAVVTAVTTLSAVAGILGALIIGVILFEVSVRVGRENRFRRFERGSDALGGGVKAQRPFRSPFWTQAWYEWRNMGWVLPCMVMILLTLYFVVVPLFTALFFTSADVRSPVGESFAERFVMNWGKNQQIISSGLLSAAAGAGILTGAYMFLVSGEWRQKSTFLRTRPMRTDSLAWVRLAVLFFSTCCATALLVVAFISMNLAMNLQDGRFDSLFWLRQGYDHVPDVLVALFFFGTLFVAMWTGLWIVNVSVAMGVYGGLALLGMAATFLLIQLTNVAGDSTVFYGVERSAVWLAVAFWIGGSVWMYRGALRDRVIPRGARRWAFGLWLVYAGAFLYYGLDIRFFADLIYPDGTVEYGARVTYELATPSSVPFTHPVDWVLWAGLSIFPILPIVSLPYRLNVMRHD